MFVWNLMQQHIFLKEVKANQFKSSHRQMSCFTFKHTKMCYLDLKFELRVHMDVSDLSRIVSFPLSIFSSVIVFVTMSSIQPFQQDKVYSKLKRQDLLSQMCKRTNSQLSPLPTNQYWSSMQLKSHMTSLISQLRIALLLSKDPTNLERNISLQISTHSVSLTHSDCDPVEETVYHLKVMVHYWSYSVCE